MRQELHKTAQRAFARCECAQHTGFRIKYFNPESALLSVEGHTVGALLDSRIALVRADHDPLKRAIVLTAAMMPALRNRTLDTTVCVIVHVFPSLAL